MQSTSVNDYSLFSVIGKGTDAKVTKLDARKINVSMRWKFSKKNLFQVTKYRPLMYMAIFWWFMVPYMEWFLILFEKFASELKIQNLLFYKFSCSFLINSFVQWIYFTSLSLNELFPSYLNIQELLPNKIIFRLPHLLKLFFSWKDIAIKFLLSKASMMIQ